MAGFEYCIRINHLDCVPSMPSWHSACNAVGIDVSGANAHESDREYHRQYFRNAPQGLCAARGLLISWNCLPRNFIQFLQLRVNGVYCIYYARFKKKFCYVVYVWTVSLLGPQMSCSIVKQIKKGKECSMHSSHPISTILCLSKFVSKARHGAFSLLMQFTAEHNDLPQGQNRLWQEKRQWLYVT